MNTAATEPTPDATDSLSVDESAPEATTTDRPATPGRVMSTLAYELLSRENVSVWVSTRRNFSVYNSSQSPTDPGDDVGWSHLRPVSDYHPFAAPTRANTGDSWGQVAVYLDDRVHEGHTGTFYGPGTEINVEWVYDEYFIRVEGPEDQNIADWGEYQTCSTLHRSNYRSLLRDYPDVFVTLTSHHDGGALLIPLFVPNEHDDYDTPHYDADRARGLADVLLGLAYEHPVYDEDDMSTLESELQDEVVSDDWFRRELLDDVAAEVTSIVFTRLLGEDYAKRFVYGTAKVDARCESIDKFRELFRDMLDNSTTIQDPDYNAPGEPGRHTVTSLFLTMANRNYGPEFENATTDGVVFRNRAETVERMARHLTGGTP